MDPEIRLRGKSFDFTVPLDDAPVTPTAGGASIEEAQRPEKTALTVFQGNELVRLDVPVFFDGWPHHGRRERSVRPDVEQVLGLCFGEEGNRPPSFVATGPMPFSGMTFLMDGLPEYGDHTYSPKANHALLRQRLTLKLVQFIDSDVIRFRSRHRIGVGQAEPVSTVTRQNDTLLIVAARIYSDPSRAHEIGALNGLRDVRKKLAAGIKLRLPGA